MPATRSRRCTASPTTRRSRTSSSCVGGRPLTAVQMQLEFLEQARKHVEDRLGSDVDAQTADVLDRWESVLDRPARPTRCRWPTELDWVAKLALLEGYRDRDGLDWDHAAAAPRRPAVRRRPPGQGPRATGCSRAARCGASPPTPRSTRAVTHAAGRHPRLVPRRVPAPLRRPGRRRLLGLGHLRHPGPRRAAAGPHPRPAARHAGARRGPARLLAHGGRAAGGARRLSHCGADSPRLVTARRIALGVGRVERVRRRPAGRDLHEEADVPTPRTRRAAAALAPGRRAGRGDRRARVRPRRSARRRSTPTSTRSSTRSTRSSRRTPRSSSAASSRRAASR